MNYCEVTFVLNPLLPAREVLVAELAERGFESFVETEDGVQAYIIEDDFNESLLKDLMTADIPELEFRYEYKTIEDQNWNAKWEESFDPIVVDDKCLIRAPFHDNLKKFEYEIVIEPKMSFGTGHHDTTHLIISKMMDMNFSGKNVLDMGCGTGVLAILAAMKGALRGDAIDIDEWAFENTVENFERNDCKNFNVIMGGAESIPADEHYDVILANINRNILVRDMHHYAEHLKSGGTILFSGFYVGDKPEIERAANACGLNMHSEDSRNEWCVLSFEKV